MAKYNSLGVPILDFHNPAGSIFYPKGLFTYAIGNTRGRDVTENFETKKGQHVDILLLASGDVRNLLVTVSELSLRKADNRPKSINFHVNDYDSSIVARNLIILEIADTINPDVPADIDFLWNIWYNMTLSQADHARLQQVLTSLIERNFDGDASFLKFQSIDVLKECRTIWRDWRDLHLNVKSVKEERNLVFEEKKVQLTSLSCVVIFEIVMAPSDVTDIMLPTSPFYQELEHWYREGSTDDDRLTSVNATLIRPFVRKWKVHYGACPFQGYLPIESDELRSRGSLTSACKEILKLRVERFQQFQKVTSLQIMSWTGDGLSLCTSGFLSKLLFDIIDTTNASDHIGLLNVLVCCGPRLKRPNESQLFTSSMLWCGMCKSIEEYYNKCIGVNPYLLPTLLGLKLAENFDLGSRKLPDRINMTEEIFCWVKAEPKRTLLKLGESSDVVRALYILAERCFGLKEACESQVYGAVLPSPLTLLRIIRQLQPLVDGRATRLLDLLHNNLSADFDRKFGLSWNLIKASIGNEREPIVEVTIRINVDVLNVECTPMPEIVILDRSNANKKFRFQWEGTFPVIYNSLRYDERRRAVTFHLCENDWKKLKKESWLNIVSTNPGLLIKSETVFLGNEDAIISVNQVDSVNTFGLFSVQEYNVCASHEDGHLLKVIKVEESEYSYKAELAICDLTKCETANMRINFYPESCPTAVNIKFGDVNGCTMHFSCSVQESSSKFQISRKLGTITCQILKRPDGTVGVLVLRNPAPIPFHALPLWNIGYAGVTQSCGKMFRTKLDQQLKLQRRSGSPFFDLRESISIILGNHMKHREIPTVYCVEDHPLIDAPYQTRSDILQKRGLVIKVEEIYKWKHLPIAKVIFYDCKRYGEIGSKSPTARGFTRVVEYFFQVALSLQAHRVPADEMEINLFLTMLNINATRTSQKNMPNLVWKRSFISPIFPREGNTNLLDFTSDNVERLRNLPFGFDSMERQILKKFPQFNFGGDVATPTASNSDRLKEPECGFCQAKSENLKRCTGCNNIFYCSKDCQRRHWKLEHKTLCEKS